MSLSAVLLAPVFAALPQVAAQDAVRTPRPIAAQPEKAPTGHHPVRVDRSDPTAASAPQRRARHATGPVADAIVAGGPAALDKVTFAAAADGRTWASGTTYKASFGRDGFTYVPFLGSDAPRNYPVQFTIAAVKVGGKQVGFARDVAPVVQGQRVVFDRGAVHEIYDLTVDGVEQTFVVTDAAAGDVDVQLDVRGELVEDTTQAGLQFVNPRGGIHYGDAFVVHGADKRAIATTYAGGRLHLHVPAAARPTGALVIDPIISTKYVPSNSLDCDQCDVAYDATNACYLLVWQRAFSQTDTDVWFEMRDDDGNPVTNSAQSIDNSSADWHSPRVANLNAYDRFLVVAEVLVASNPAGQQYTIWGRTVDAATPFARSSQFQVSSTHSGNKRDPDVGGDPSLTAPSYWTVAYTRDFSATDKDIHARQVQADATVRAGTILVEDTASTNYHTVQISQSNGDVAVDRKRWALVYSRNVSTGNSDIYGATLTWDGQIAQPSRVIDGSIADSFAPRVSSPIDRGTSLQFGVVYFLNGTSHNLAGSVLDGQLLPVVGMTNLSAVLGASGAGDARIETDGCRFVVGYLRAANAYLATLAVAGNSLVEHESPQLVDATHDADAVNLVSRACGGRVDAGTAAPTTHYGFVYIDRNAPVDRVVFTTYDGHAFANTVIRGVGCGNLPLLATGPSWLGGTMTFTLSNLGSDVPGLLIGAVGPATMICAGCRVGVDLAGPLVHLPNVASAPIMVPRLTHLVGASFCVQGYAAGTGSCLGLLRLSDAYDVAIK